MIDNNIRWMPVACCVCTADWATRLENGSPGEASAGARLHSIDELRQRTCPPSPLPSLHINPGCPWQIAGASKWDILNCARALSGMVEQKEAELRQNAAEQVRAA